MSGDFGEVRVLAADLRRASLSVQRRAAMVVRTSAFLVEAAAKRLAPVDTGFLRNSIGVDWAGVSAVIGPTAEYGPYQEFGTAHNPPQPYMNPAADQVEPMFIAAMERLVSEAL